MKSNLEKCIALHKYDSKVPHVPHYFENAEDLARVERAIIAEQPHEALIYAQNLKEQHFSLKSEQNLLLFVLSLPTYTRAELLYQAIS